MKIEDLPDKYRKQAKQQIERQNKPIKPLSLEKDNKYHNRKETIGKLKFDSKKERLRYEELALMEKQGLISNLKLQHNFTLREGYTTTDGERVQGTIYKADFTYYDEHGNFIIEDCKGMKTDIYKLKYKMMMDKGYKITEI